MKLSNSPQQSLNLVKNTKSRLKTRLIRLKRKIKYFSIFFIFFISIVYSEMPDKFSLDDAINSVPLIVKVKLLSKKTEYETGPQYYVDHTGNVIRTIMERTIMTTFIFSVNEVLKGRYDAKSISVKMDGGCDKSNHCDLFPWNYDYEKNEEGILFLRNKYNNQEQYIAPESSNSTFALDENGNLTRKSIINKNKELGKISEHNPTKFDETNQADIINTLTIEELRTTINELSKEESK